MKWLKAWWDWRRRRPKLERYMKPIIVNGREVGYDDVSGSWQRFLNDLTLWRLDRP